LEVNLGVFSKWTFSNLGKRGDNEKVSKMGVLVAQHTKDILCKKNISILEKKK